MPPVTRRQAPVSRHTGNGVLPPTSLLDQAIDVMSLSDDWVKLTVYGENRTGKTTLACTFPKPALLISFEPNKTGGAKSIKKIPGVKILRIKYKPQPGDEKGTLYGTDSALKVAQELQAGSPYTTVILDSATSYQDLHLQELLKLDSLPEQQQFTGVSGDVYRQRSEKVKEGLRPFLNLNMHVVITAKQKDHNPPKEERYSKTGALQPDMRAKFLRGAHDASFFASDLGGAAVSWLHDNCDYIGQLLVGKEIRLKKGTPVKVAGQMKPGMDEWVWTGRYIRQLRCQYHPNYAAGFRSPHPEKVPDFIDEPSYEKIQSVIDGTYEPDYTLVT